MRKGISYISYLEISSTGLTNPES